MKCKRCLHSKGEESSSVDLESESQKVRSNTLTLLVITTSREEMLMNIVIKKDLSFHVNSTRIFKEGNPNGKLICISFISYFFTLPYVLQFHQHTIFQLECNGMDFIHTLAPIYKNLFLISTKRLYFWNGKIRRT